MNGTIWANSRHENLKPMGIQLAPMRLFFLAPSQIVYITLNTINGVVADFVLIRPTNQRIK
jgi:hypothetical protein